MNLQGLAARAVLTWGGSTKAPELLSHRENAVFDVTLPTGRAALRLHRPRYRTDSEIESELAWTQELAGNGFPAPRPIAMRDGAFLLHLGEGQRATVIEWMDGAPIGAGGDALNSSSVTEYTDIGKLLAQLHDQTIAMGADKFDRPRWDIDGLTGEQPLWGRYWEMPSLTRSQRDLVISARSVARNRLKSYLKAGAEVTLIHTDALRENVFRNLDGLALIDFDDSGFGFVIYDLAASVTQCVDDPLYPDVKEAILDGYASVRSIGADDRAHFDMFAMLRAFSAMGWTIPRMPHDHPKLPVYVRRAVDMAERFLN